MLTELIYINLVDLVHFSRFSHFFSLFFLLSQSKTSQLFLKMDLGFYAFYFLSFLRFLACTTPKKLIVEILMAYGSARIAAAHWLLQLVST